MIKNHFYKLIVLTNNVTFIFKELILRMSYRDYTFAKRPVAKFFQIRHNSDIT
jgi:hypothetical protein